MSKTIMLEVFDDQLDMLRDVLNNKYDYLHYLDETHGMLGTIAKCVLYEDYYASYTALRLDEQKTLDLTKTNLYQMFIDKAGHFHTVIDISGTFEKKFLYREDKTFAAFVDYLTHKKVGFTYFDAHNAWRNYFDHTILVRYDLFISYLEFMKEASVPLGAAVWAWVDHIENKNYLEDTI